MFKQPVGLLEAATAGVPAQDRIGLADVGIVTRRDVVAPEGYTITGEGKGGIAGFAKGTALIRLDADGPDATVLRYDVNTEVGGKIAQLGARLLDSTAKKLAKQFFDDFNNLVSDGAASGLA